MAHGISDMQKVKLEKDEALLVTVKLNDVNADDVQVQLANIKKRITEVVPNADMSRVLVVAIGSEDEIEYTKVKMERKT